MTFYEPMSREAGSKAVQLSNQAVQPFEINEWVLRRNHEGTGRKQWRLTLSLCSIYRQMLFRLVYSLQLLLYSKAKKRIRHIKSRNFCKVKLCNYWSNYCNVFCFRVANICLILIYTALISYSVNFYLFVPLFCDSGSLSKDSQGRNKNAA